MFTATKNYLNRKGYHPDYMLSSMKEEDFAYNNSIKIIKINKSDNGAYNV